MVYIFKKVVAGKNKYYLRVSKRQGTKVIAKDIAYLGTAISDVKKNLDKLGKYKDQIRKSYRTINKVLESNYWLEKAHEKKFKQNEYLKEIRYDLEACKLHFNEVFKKKKELTQNEILKQFIIDFSYNTTSIEGNTITLKEARRLLEEGLTPQNKTIREIYDLQNNEEVFFDWKNFDINHKSIIEIHKRLMDRIDQRIGYRTEDVHVFRARFESSPAKYVKTDMDLLVKWYKKNNNLHPLVLATLFHHKFEKIHPFMDGNGRTGRMLINLILLKKKFPPVIIQKKLRSEYLEALSIADKEDINSIAVTNYKKLIQFVADELISGYWGLFL